jgi:hypothetical protein
MEFQNRQHGVAGNDLGSAQLGEGRMAVKQRGNACQHKQIGQWFLEGRYMIHGSRITTFSIAILLSLSFAAIAAELTIPNTFSNGAPADADEVNANFEAVRKAVNENNLIDGGVVNGPLTVPSVTYSSPKSGSVTYSAMGFTPDKSEADNFDHATEFEKKAGSGSLNCLEQDGCSFYHGVNLRTGVTITQIRAHVFDSDDTADNASIEVKLQKKMIGENMVTNLASGTSDNSGDQVFGTELDEFIEWSSTEYPPSYFIEVVFGNSSKNVLLFSVTIDYTYTAP